MTHPAFDTKFEQAQIEAFLAQSLNARLATAVPRRDEPAYAKPHNVPVWFLWDGEALWISAFQSTRKLKEVLRNPYVSILIDVEQAYQGVTAILFEGKAEVILESEIVQDMSTRIYTKYMGEEGVKAAAPQSWIIDPENAIIRLCAQKVFTW